MFIIDKQESMIIVSKLKRDGDLIEICRIIDTAKDRLIIIDKTKLNSYTFKSDTLKLKIAGGNAVGSFTGKVRIFAKPNPMQYHNELMRYNRLRFYLGDKRNRMTVEQLAQDKKYQLKMLDSKLIFNNMLDCIANI